MLADPVNRPGFAVQRSGTTSDVAFDGITVMYSWPSQGRVLGYWADEATVEWTVPHLVKVLEQVVATTGVDRVHVIAHSMGNRALVRAVQAVASEYPGKPAFNQIVLAAPDIDAGVYLEQIAPAIRSDASRVTLYASSRDAALMASSRLHRFARAGYSGVDLVIADGIDTIDASAVDTDLLGHSYTVEEKEVLDDLFNLFRHKMQPSGRNLRRTARGAATFWSLP
jgi:esterase/lipase superfamily enzyme